MKLYITPGSPYARIARVLVLEKDLTGRVEIVVVQIRQRANTYYRVNPSGRVPCLVRDDGVALEESPLICAYLDALDGKARFTWSDDEAGWEGRRLESHARSLLDGLAVWGRELRRPETERSPTVLRHEAERSQRLLELWDSLIDHPLMQGPLNLAQITLIAAFGFGARIAEFQWRKVHPQLCVWVDRINALPSIAATAPPEQH